MNTVCSGSETGGRRGQRQRADIWMEHGEAGDGEIPQDLFYGGSIEDIDAATAYQYDMYGGNASAGVEDCHVTPIESVQPATISRKKNVTAKRVAHRGTAFTKEEDNILCLAFLNVGKDPIVGINQNMDGYYKRIYDYYQARKPEGSIRSQISLQKRWCIIQKAVSKFCSFKSAVDRRNESGKNEYDRIEDAVKMYEATEPFHFMHCWKQLRDEAKWNDKLLELRSTTNAAKVGTKATCNPENVNNAPTDRPEGRDSAKRRRSKEDTASSSAAIEVLQQIYDRNINVEGKQEQQMQEILSMKGNKIELTQKMFDLQKEDMEVRSKLKAEQLSISKEQLSLTKQDIEVRAKQSEAQLLTAEVGIMGADLEKLSLVVREYYVMM